MSPRPPRQNRVLPTGEIVRHPARGLFMGNRGCLHDAEGNLGAARWRSTLWIVCKTAFRDRQRQLMTPGRYTELFFLDEAVALAAGHRPCAECRRTDYRRFLECWGDGHRTAVPKAGEIDRALHTARIEPGTRTQRTYWADIGTLPDGVFVRLSTLPHMLLSRAAYPFASYAYGAPIERPAKGVVDVMTPLPTVNTLSAGYLPSLHPDVTQ